MEIIRLALLALLIAAFADVLFARAWNSPNLDVLETKSDLLEHVIMTEVEIEINETKRLLKLYERKAGLLLSTLARIRQRSPELHWQNKAMSTKTPVNASLQRPPATKEQRHQTHRGEAQLFRDRFESQCAFTLRDDDANAHSSSTVQLISFRPNASPLGKKRQKNAPRHNVGSGFVKDEAPLQFLLVLDQQATVMKLFHPITHKLVWKYALNLRATTGDATFEIADVVFVSERSAHLAILSTAGELVLFKLRLWHNRRVVSGDPRRLRNMDEARLQCLAGQDPGAMTNVIEPPWLKNTMFAVAAPPSGRYLHVDVEHVFGTALSRSWSYRRGKVALSALYNRVVVVTSDESGMHLTFHDGESGSNITELRTRRSDGTTHGDGVVQLQAVQIGRGLLALTTRKRLLFVDPNTQQQIPVECEVPGRHEFTSFAADPLRPNIIYAGTSVRRAFVYKLHNLRTWRQRAEEADRDYRGPAICMLVDQLMPHLLLPPSYHKSPAVVETLPGFLVLGIGTRLVLYQLSASSEWVYPTHLSEHSLITSPVQELHTVLSPFARDLHILGISAAKDLSVHSAGFAVLMVAKEVPGNSTAPTQRLEIFSSRIPPPGANLDLSWIRIPAMMVCALAAMFWQQRGRMAHSADRRGGFDEAEIANLLSRMRASGN